MFNPNEPIPECPKCGSSHLEEDSLEMTVTCEECGWEGLNDEGIACEAAEYEHDKIQDMKAVGEM